jgi:CxxC-x17-CxxC domain-containing protein
MSPADVMLTCRDCTVAFVFTAEERESQAHAGRTHPPSRCPECRAERKARQEQIGGVRVAPGFRDRREQAAMTTTTCSACGKPAVLPFVMRGDRAAFCSPCFEQRRASGENAARR